MKPILQKVKKINVDHIGKVARDNNTISSSFVKVTWNKQLIRFSEVGRFF